MRDFSRVDHVEPTLRRLIESWENEVVEFKRGKDNFSSQDIAKYFSALSNEANLNHADSAWLIFGVDDKTRTVVGTSFRRSQAELNALKLNVSQITDPSSGFRSVREEIVEGERVILFEIPPAPRGMPISSNGHYYAREGESLVPMSMSKIEAIRSQTRAVDWTAQVVETASLDDLDPRAIELARQNFSQKHANMCSFEEVATWPLNVFTDRAKLTVNGRITRAALLLCGKSSSSWHLSPHPAQITWKLIGEEMAYEHFGPPFFLATSEVFRRIRNVQLRLLPDDALIPEEVSKYDQATILEALHNCIAHQDYEKFGRVLVTEYPERVTFQNEGEFFEGAPTDYVSGERTPRRYRNPFLVSAMVELNMIDTMGYGIHRMHDRQAKRYLPLPDYEKSTGASVEVAIFGRVVDPSYTRQLMQRTDLPLETILALDRVQKKLEISAETARYLRREKLIEGRKPNLFVSSVVAKSSHDRAKYIRTRPQDDMHYARLVEDYVKKFPGASRRDIDNLLLDKLSDGLNDSQKRNKITNLLAKMRRNGLIENRGPNSKPSWHLVDSN